MEGWVGILLGDLVEAAVPVPPGAATRSVLSYPVRESAYDSERPQQQGQ